MKNMDIGEVENGYQLVFCCTGSLSGAGKKREIDRPLLIERYSERHKTETGTTLSWRDTPEGSHLLGIGSPNGCAMTTDTCKRSTRAITIRWSRDIESKRLATEAVSSSSSTTITITMYAVAEEQPS